MSSRPRFLLQRRLPFRLHRRSGDLDSQRIRLLVCRTTRSWSASTQRVGSASSQVRPVAPAQQQRICTWPSGVKLASTLSEDIAPSASLDCLKAQAAPTHPGAPPEHLGGSPWPQQPASARSQDDDFSLSTTRSSTRTCGQSERRRLSQLLSRIFERQCERPSASGRAVLRVHNNLWCCYVR